MSISVTLVCKNAQNTPILSFHIPVYVKFCYKYVSWLGFLVNIRTLNIINHCLGIREYGFHTVTFNTTFEFTQ